MKKYALRLALVPVVLFASVSSFAAGTPIDVTSTTDTITAQLAPIGAIGAACLAIYVAVKAYHWVRRALS